MEYSNKCHFAESGTGGQDGVKLLRCESKNRLPFYIANASGGSRKAFLASVLACWAACSLAGISGVQMPCVSERAGRWDGPERDSKTGCILITAAVLTVCVGDMARALLESASQAGSQPSPPFAVNFRGANREPLSDGLAWFHGDGARGKTA